MRIAIAAIPPGSPLLAGTALLQHSSPGTVVSVLCFVAGAILDHARGHDDARSGPTSIGGKPTGVATTLDFAIAATHPPARLSSPDAAAPTGGAARPVEPGGNQEGGVGLSPRPGPGMGLPPRITRSRPAGVLDRAAYQGTAAVTRGQTDRPADLGCST